MSTETVERPLAEAERSTGTDNRKRTTAATEARQRQAANRKARDVALTIGQLDDETLGMLNELFMTEVLTRGYALPDVGQWD